LLQQERRAVRYPLRHRARFCCTSYEPTGACLPAFFVESFFTVSRLQLQMSLAMIQLHDAQARRALYGFRSHDNGKSKYG
jgi:hypothetical protein